jgi:hypothetical protein
LILISLALNLFLSMLAAIQAPIIMTNPSIRGELELWIWTG